MSTITCTGCRRVLDEEAFAVNRSRENGRQIWCRECNRAARAATSATAARVAPAQTFGVELEYAGINTERAAEVVQTVVGGTVERVYETTQGHTVNGYRVVAADGRKWVCEYDASIQASQSAEVVTPVLTMADMETLQKIVRALRAAGAVTNSTTGMHVHVGCPSWKVAARAATLFGRVQTALYAGAEVLSAREVWAARLDTYRSSSYLFARSDAGLRTAWYGRNMPVETIRGQKYVSRSRYRGINLCSFWRISTVEFRLFNSTTHAGKVRAAVELALGLMRAAERMHNIEIEAVPMSSDNLASMTAVLNLAGMTDTVTRNHFCAHWGVAPVADTDATVTTATTVTQDFAVAI